jgi:hypothetical protein
MTSCFSLSGLNFAFGVLYHIEPRSFALDSPTFSTISTARVSGEGGIWREKSPDADFTVGTDCPKVRAPLVRCTWWKHPSAFRNFTFLETLFVKLQ